MTPAPPRTDDLFAHAAARDRRGQPLAERMRPRSLDELLGQQHLFAPQAPLQQLLQRRRLPSLILWGPPGTGKTSLARLLAAAVGAQMQSISAVLGGVKEVRAAVDAARLARDAYGRPTLLFIDEIHRFNRTQQDALLPHVEAGTLTLVGATTENPAFELGRALMSRCRLFVLEPLAPAALVGLLRRALADRDRGLGSLGLVAADDALDAIAHQADGDARRALSTLEVAASLCQPGPDQRPVALSLQQVRLAEQAKLLLHDKQGDLHHQCISAFIKAMRGSDPDAAVYHLVRLLEAGESPRFLLRRMVIFASEDVGNAAPQALQVATAALQAFDLMGLPEGTLPLSQAAIYLACAPKSDAVLQAFRAAKEAVQDHGALPVPPHLRPAAPTGTAAAARYVNPHTAPGHFVPQTHLPDRLLDQIFYVPSDQGEEAALGERLARWRAARSGVAG